MAERKDEKDLNDETERNMESDAEPDSTVQNETATEQAQPPAVRTAAADSSPSVRQAQPGSLSNKLLLSMLARREVVVPPGSATAQPSDTPQPEASSIVPPGSATAQPSDTPQPEASLVVPPGSATAQPSDNPQPEASLVVPPGSATAQPSDNPQPETSAAVSESPKRATKRAEASDISQMAERKDQKDLNDETERNMESDAEPDSTVQNVTATEQAQSLAVRSAAADSSSSVPQAQPGSIPKAHPLLFKILSGKQDDSGALSNFPSDLMKEIADPQPGASAVVPPGRATAQSNDCPQPEASTFVPPRSATAQSNNYPQPEASSVVPPRSATAQPSDNPQPETSAAVSESPKRATKRAGASGELPPSPTKKVKSPKKSPEKKN